jgi:hypothetical protein
MSSKKESFESLMPVINPNLDEIVVEGKNEPLQEMNPTRPKPKEKDIFVAKSNSKITKGGNSTKKSKINPQAKITEGRKEENEKLNEKTDDLRQAENKGATTSKKKVKGKRNYDHLKKAREKALANRKKKAEEKKLLRQAEKEEKERLKEEKRQLRIEKNRERARKNYHKKKDLKEIENIEKQEIIEKIGEINNPTAERKVKKLINNGSMTYEKFAMFMTMYEREKQLIHRKKEKVIPKPKPKKNVKVVNKIVSKHPPNYYNPNRHRRGQDVNDLFRM